VQVSKGFSFLNVISVGIKYYCKNIDINLARDMPLFKSSRKVQDFGSSSAITLPARFVKVHELEKGSILKVFFCLDGVLVVSCVDDEEVLSERLVKLIERLDEEMKEEKDATLSATHGNRRARQPSRYGGSGVPRIVKRPMRMP